MFISGYVTGADNESRWMKLGFPPKRNSAEAYASRRANYAANGHYVGQTWRSDAGAHVLPRRLLLGRRRSF